MSQLNVDSIKDRTGADQPNIVGVAKAFVNFNGTGTVAIRSSFNVSSITDNGTGDYTVNFTNALEDADYAASITAKGISGTSVMVAPADIYIASVGTLRFSLAGQAGASSFVADSDVITVVLYLN